MPASVSTPSTSIASSRTRRSLARGALPELCVICLLIRRITNVRFVGRNDCLELADDHVLAAAVEHLIQFPDLVIELVRIELGLARRSLDFVMRGRLDALRVIEQLLAKLLPGPEPGVPELDVLFLDPS